MLVFVDFEHATGYAGEHAERIRSARTWLTYRLEDLADAHCHLVRYDRVDQALLDTLGATAIFISGNSVRPDVYTDDEIASLAEIVRTTRLPVFGFCGGFQLIARALGVEVVALTPADVADDDPMIVTTDDGRAVEFGYHPIDVDAEWAGHPLVEGLGDTVMRHAHGFHVPVLPPGFVRLAATRTTPNQLAVHADRRIVGSQFHPEYWTDEHPAGRVLIANFLRWTGVATGEPRPG